jgi:hypothetical protein
MQTMLVRSSLATFVLLAAGPAAQAQNALGGGDALSRDTRHQDTRRTSNYGVLDASTRVGSFGDNGQAAKVDYYSRNLIVTGDVGGGREFRGSVGYREQSEFTGNTGADDLRRCEFSARYAEVPWFAIDGDTLQLRGVPVPARAPRRSDEPFVQHLLGHSAALDWLCWNTVPVWWVGDQREVRVHEKGTGARIAELLLTRLAALCRQRGVRLVLVLQGYEIGADADRVLAFARAHGLAVFDLVRTFQREAASDPGMYTRCFDGHMTAAGNAWVAQQLAVALRRD